MFRAPGCDGGGPTTVLAHLRFYNIAGMGMKPPDTCAAWLCGPCHDVLDGRRRIDGYGPALIRQDAFAALLRTLKALDEEGYQMTYRGTK